MLRPADRTQEYVILLFGRVVFMYVCAFTLEWWMTAVNMNLCAAEYTLCHPTVAHFVTKGRNAVLC